MPPNPQPHPSQPPGRHGARRLPPQQGNDGRTPHRQPNPHVDVNPAASVAGASTRVKAARAAEAQVRRARRHVEQLGRVQDRAASLAGVIALEARDRDSRVYTFAAMTMAHTVYEVWQAAEAIAEVSRVDALLALLESGVVRAEGGGL